MYVNRSRLNDEPRYWTLRLGEVVIDDYIVVFGYVPSVSYTKDMFIRLYRVSDQHQIFGLYLGDIKSDSQPGLRFTVNGVSLFSGLFDKIQAMAERFEKLKVFA